MYIELNTNNMLQLQGRVVSVKEYSAGRAANLTLAIDNGRNKAGKERAPHFIQLKSFVPPCYNALKVGTKVHVYGHIEPGKYEKQGTMVYVQDIVADVVEFLEPLSVMDESEEKKGGYES